MRKSSVSRAVIWSAVDIFFRHGVNFVIIIMLMRALEPEAFGIVAMLGIFTSIASLFIDGGLSQALIQRQNVSHTDESSIFFLNLFMGLLVALVLCFSAPWISTFYKTPILRDITYVMALGLFINAFGSVHISLLTKNLNFKVIAQVGIIVSLLSGLIALMAAYNGLGVWSLVLQTLSTSFLTVIMLWILYPWRPKWVFNFLSIRSFWRFSGYLILSGFLYRIYANVFFMVIGRTYFLQELDNLIIPIRKKITDNKGRVIAVISAGIDLKKRKDSKSTDKTMPIVVNIAMQEQANNTILKVFSTFTRAP